MDNRSHTVSDLMHKIDQIIQTISSDNGLKVSRIGLQEENEGEKEIIHFRKITDYNYKTYTKSKTEK